MNRKIIISLGVVVLLGLGIWYYAAHVSHKPMSFADRRKYALNGTITKIDGNHLTLHTALIESNVQGNNAVKADKIVDINADTAITKTKLGKPISFSEIKVGDIVTVYSAQDSYSKNEFTATEVSLNAPVY